ncbi:hypothetical protein ACTWQL_04540 [Pseudalkalibacillus sp. R45]|uniref:hypothetical protein n=1 Tax=Pseudalkalibacillus sp. R45 TaxID=3457433 RepID=UPI003FCD1810
MARLKRLLGPTSLEEPSHDSEAHANDIVDRIKEMMWYHGNFVRSELQLTSAIEEIKAFESRLDSRRLFENMQARKLAIKTRNFMNLSQILLQAILERRESREAHYREDHPNDNPQYAKRLFISKNEEVSIVYEFINKC